MSKNNTKEEKAILGMFCNPIQWLNECEEGMQKWLDEYKERSKSKNEIDDMLYGNGL